ncbi:MAG: hypothetical protein JWO72_2713 [Caulobacteraceae bacterium]|nr:hypothetical protein [Caulobacteraceae bacterium]
MPPNDVLYWASFVAFALLLAAASLVDLRRRRIPNVVVLALVGLFVMTAAAFPAHVDLKSSLVAALVALSVSGLLYTFGMVGAGDSKLFTAIALFTGLHRLWSFSLLTAFLGGILAVVYLAFAGRRRAIPMRERTSIPYGVSIALAGIIVRFAETASHPAGPLV